MTVTHTTNVEYMMVLQMRSLGLMVTYAQQCVNDGSQIIGIEWTVTPATNVESNTKHVEPMLFPNT